MPRGGSPVWSAEPAYHRDWRAGDGVRGSAAQLNVPVADHHVRDPGPSVADQVGHAVDEAQPRWLRLSEVLHSTPRPAGNSRSAVSERYSRRAHVHSLLSP